MNLHEQVKLTAVIEPAPEGGFTSSFEELPEVFSEGETIEEAEANLFDALKLVMDSTSLPFLLVFRPPAFVFGRRGVSIPSSFAGAGAGEVFCR